MASSAVGFESLRYGIGTHEWDVPITNLMSLAHVSHILHTRRNYLTFNVEIVGKHFRDSIPACYCAHQTFYLLAVYECLRVKPGEKILVPSRLYVDQYDVFHSLPLHHYLSMHTQS